MKLGENLKTLRVKRNLTQKAVANSVNVSNVSIQNYERGFRNPPLETLIALADFFNVSLDSLVGREFPQDSPPPQQPPQPQKNSLEERIERLERLLQQKS